MQAGQIVAGINAGKFLILGEREFHGTKGFQLKSVNPDNFSQMAHGEIWLDANSLRELTKEEREQGTK